MDKLRILFVSLSVPYPPSNGHRMRNWALLQALAEEGHELTLVSFAEQQELDGVDHVLRKTCRHVQLVPLPPAARNGAPNYWNRARAFPSPLPYGAWRYRSEAMAAAVRDTLAKEEFHVLFCDDVYQVKNLPEPIQTPVLLNKHDITHVILRRYLAHEQSPAKSAYGWAEYRKLRRWEARVSSHVVQVLACSEEDRAILERLCPNARVAVVPNSIDVSKYAPQGADDGRTILYFGAMDWYPNQDAVEFFMSAIFPELQEVLPELRFRIAGRCPSKRFRKGYAGVPGVEITGTVQDVSSEIARATVCVVPLRIGSGTRLKILEAAAMAKPIVSTHIGAEGLDFVNGEEILLADEPRQFARAVTDLLADPARRRAMGLAARRRVEARYSFPVLRAALREALAPLTAKASTVNHISELSAASTEVCP